MKDRVGMDWGRVEGPCLCGRRGLPPRAVPASGSLSFVESRGIRRMAGQWGNRRA